MKTHPYLLQSIANTVEKLRKNKSLTKSALADFADIERCYLRGILNGTRNPTVNTVFSLCMALQISPTDFFKEVLKEMDTLKNDNGRDKS